MQKRVGVARLGPVFPLLVALGVVQYRVVFRMQQDDIDGEVIQPGQDLALTLLAPGIEEKLSDLLAAGVEHGMRRLLEDWFLVSHKSRVAENGEDLDKRRPCVRGGIYAAKEVPLGDKGGAPPLFVGQGLFLGRRPFVCFPRLRVKLRAS